MTKRFNPSNTIVETPEKDFDPGACLLDSTASRTSMGAILAAFASGQPEDIVECEEDVEQLSSRLNDILDVLAAFWSGTSNRLDPKTVASAQQLANELVRVAFDLQAAVSLACEYCKEGGRHE